jgi:DNA-binding CsgD family transcriptional regulator
MMSFWYRLLRTLGFKTPVVRTYHLDDEQARSLRLLAETEELSEQQITARLLADAFARQEAYQGLVQRWRMLSPREQQVTSLICLHYTTGEIAAQLMISESTVRSHVRRILEKFGVHSRTELCILLADWNFEIGA